MELSPIILLSESQNNGVKMKRFPSIKSNIDFQTVYTQGISYANKVLVMYLIKKEEDGNRLGISVSKKIGNSVVRHRYTRILREIFRLNHDKILQGYDIILVVRNGIKECGYDAIEQAYLHLCKRHKIWNG